MGTEAAVAYFKVRSWNLPGWRLGGGGADKRTRKPPYG